MSQPVSTYPVDISLTPQLSERNRVTVAFRIILAIPHLILVGGGTRIGNGVLGAVALVCGLIAWFAILFTGKHPRGLWDMGAFYVRWHTRSDAYLMLFLDDYPPFGDADYPASVTLSFPDGPRDRLSVGLRLIYAIPHLIVVAVLAFAWLITSLIAWFAILYTGSYPAGLAEFGVNVMRWAIRLEAYMLLLRDEYPPFSLHA